LLRSAARGVIVQGVTPGMERAGSIRVERPRTERGSNTVDLVVYVLWAGILLVILRYI
jgi:hypothetical protein